MGDNHRTPGEAGDEPAPPETDRRKFLRKSLGAFPVVWTLGNRSGWKGTSMHGTLWSSTGTEWKHRRRRWRGRWWDDRPPTPPPWKSGRSGSNEDREERSPERELPPRQGWDWDAPRDDWRSWRPEADDDATESWHWSKRDGKSAPPVDSMGPIEETIQRKKE